MMRMLWHTGQVLQHSGQIHRRASAHALRILALSKVPIRPGQANDQWVF